LSVLSNANVIRGMDSMDNAGVYKISETIALIQTLDFFTPIVDDPYNFGQIAAANSLSDVYTMGAKPITAMNIVCFPSKKMDILILQEILSGGLDKMNEAGVVLIGGHSVEDDELKYGLSVTGSINPKKLITNAGAKVGDLLILTKALGTGIISTAMKVGRARKRTIEKITFSMAQLNKTASELMIKYRAHSCTDITGFGLAGHMQQMAQNSNIGMTINTNCLPFFAETRAYSDMGLIPGGLHKNKDFYINHIEYTREIPDYLQDLIYDPQTSGGLLISIEADRAFKLLKALKRAGYKKAAIIGEVIKEPKGKIVIS
jgi:selenide,water dikinase